jgi:hypothetical protein
MRTKRMGVAAALTALLAASALLARAASPTDPTTALREINAWYADQQKKAQESKKQIDYQALMNERKAKAKAAVEGLDPAKTEPARCYDLALLYSMAEMPKEMVAAAQRFAASGPEPRKKFAAQQLMLYGYQTLGDAEGIVKALDEMVPPDAQTAAVTAAMIAGGYAQTVAEKMGATAALDLIRKAESRVPFNNLKTNEEKQIAEYAVANIASGRADILSKAGRKDEALAVLEKGMKQFAPDSRWRKSLESKIKLAKLPGSPAPPLKSERSYGDFKGLEALRGKVVMLDFTAHW